MTNTIQAALNDVQSGQTIVVQPGVYHENLTYPWDPITQWGIDFTLRSRDPENWQAVAATVIQGTGGQKVITYTGDERQNSWLEGFTIRGGSVAGIYAYGNAPNVRRCLITDNTGCGISGVLGNITECIIVNNGSTTNYRAGGVDSTGGLVSHCLVLNNYSYLWAGGMANIGGALRNSVIAENRARLAGGGVAWVKSASDIRHCTIVNNTAGTVGGGLFYENAGNLYLRHCIAYGNTASNGNQISIGYALTTLNVDYCDVQGDENGVYKPVGTLNWGNSNLVNAAPGFVAEETRDFESALYDAATDQTTLTLSTSESQFTQDGLVGRLLYVMRSTRAQDKVRLVAGYTENTITVWGDASGGTSGRLLEYHLASDSGCVDAGDSSFTALAGETDIDGQPRVAGDRVDIGADELSDAPSMARGGEMGLEETQELLRQDASGSEESPMAGLMWELRMQILEEME